jgi:CRP/FNR family cyclic AMP-dependent transcriptional regulator
MTQTITMLRMAAQKPGIAETLHRVPIFSGLTESQLEFLSKRTVERKYGNGELIFSEGDPCAGLFVVQFGNARIFKSAATGREQVLSIEGPGSSVAELPVFDGGSYPASAQALNNTTMLFVSKQAFQSLCLEHPEVALKVLKIVGARLRRLVGIIEELSFTTVRHRLTALLLRAAKDEKKKSDGAVEIVLGANNQELAAQLGTVRELVSRNLSRLQAEGLIRMDGRSIVIPDIEKLAAELQGQE